MAYKNESLRLDFHGLMWSNVTFFSYLKIESLRLDLYTNKILKNLKHQVSRTIRNTQKKKKEKRKKRNPETQQSDQREKESRDSKPCWTNLIPDHQPEIIWGDLGEKNPGSAWLGSRATWAAHGLGRAWPR